jgi:glucose/arabinose dehydrogenase
MRPLLVAAVLVLVACGESSNETSVTSSSSIDVDVNAIEPGLDLLVEVDEPVDASSRTGDEALYVVSRAGVIWRVVEGALETDPALDISDMTVAEGERGLLGLAFSPDGGVAYLNFTDRAGDTVIVRLDVMADGSLDRSSMRTLLTIGQPYSNHNGGDVVVEPDGMLLVATGDGGSGGDPDRLALDDRSLLGKVLRIDPDSGAVQIIARGLRNPWRIDLFEDRLWLADVGQGEWEEVSVLDGVSQLRSVVDFGWSAFEGNERFNEDQTSIDHVPPVMVYEHGDDGCSVSGGAVVTSGSLAGRYLFADYCSGKVWSIAIDKPNPAKELVFEGLDSSVAVVRAGEEVYLLTLSGSVLRLIG